MTTRSSVKRPQLLLTPDSRRLSVLSGKLDSIEQSLADLVDNSISAGATNVLIRFIHDRDRILRIAVADDGNGMNKTELSNAMRFGLGRVARLALVSSGWA